MGNGSVDGGEGRRVGGSGGKNLRSSAARNPLLNGLDVCRVAGTGEQGRQREVDVAGFVSVKNVAVIIGGRDLPRVSIQYTFNETAVLPESCSS